MRLPGVLPEGEVVSTPMENRVEKEAGRIGGSQVAVSERACGAGHEKGINPKHARALAACQLPAQMAHPCSWWIWGEVLLHQGALRICVLTGW